MWCHQHTDVVCPCTVRLTDIYQLLYKCSPCVDVHPYPRLWEMLPRVHLLLCVWPVSLGHSEYSLPCCLDEV